LYDGNNTCGWKIVIVNLILKIQWNISIAEHTFDNNSQWEEHLSSPTKNRIKITSLVNQDNTTVYTTSSYEEDQK